MPLFIFQLKQKNQQFHQITLHQITQFSFIIISAKYMFTGIIKLAQIDDYISPSQNCIQPKIMKPTKQQQKKATVSLNDCLACSGCITSAESILVEQMSLKKFKQLVNTEQNQAQQVIVIISPQSLLSLSRYYKIDPQLLFRKISAFFQNNFKRIKQVYNLWQGIRICHEMIFKQYLQKSQTQQVVLCSQCPGWICYAQKTLNLQITQLMSEVKSPQQILSRIIKQSYKSQSSNKPYPKVISIMPCYDKKLQAIRFQFQNSIKQLDLTLTTTQIVDLLKQFPENCLESIQLNHKSQMQLEQPFTSTKMDQQKIQQKKTQKLNFLKDQTSNGYIETILQRLNATDIQVKEIKNSDFIQYTAITSQGKQVKMAKCYGFRNIQKIVQTIKKKKCLYSYVEIMACPGGCYSGGGQIRYTQVKQKQICQDFKKMSKQHINENISTSKQQQNNYAHLKDKLKIIYKPIQKTLTQSVMNW